jgi:putative transposase
MWARVLTGASAGTGSRRSSSARWSGCGSASKLGLRDIPEVMAARGVEVSHETVREWCDKFGAAYAKEIRRRRPRPGDKWHLDELVVKINGVHRYLWRAVDQQGITLGMLVTRRRDASAASRFLRKLLKS